MKSQNRQNGHLYDISFKFVTGYQQLKTNKLQLKELLKVLIGIISTKAIPLNRKCLLFDASVVVTVVHFCFNVKRDNDISLRFLRGVWLA